MCGRKFRVINNNQKTDAYKIAVIDCKCGVMLEYSYVTEKLEVV